MLKNIRKNTLFFIILVTLSACSYQEEAANKTKLTEATKETVTLDVYKDPSCGCCGDWIKHTEKYGFLNTVHHPEDLSLIKKQHGITPRLQSCHTAVSPSGYVFEGHIPAKLVQQFLENPPVNAIGLTVPGMPMESPGMEMGGTFTPYDVLVIHKDGSTAVFAHISDQQSQY